MYFLIWKCFNYFFTDSADISVLLTALSGLGVSGRDKLSLRVKENAKLNTFSEHLGEKGLLPLCHCLICAPQRISLMKKLKENGERKGYYNPFYSSGGRGGGGLIYLIWGYTSQQYFCGQKLATSLACCASVNKKSPPPRCSHGDQQKCISRNSLSGRMDCT